jgi:hypothetical protein
MKKRTAADVAAMGGAARAKKLSPARRSELAKSAAEARWSADVPRATHEGPLRIGDVEIPCAVLEDGTRVLSRFGFMTAIGRKGKAKGGRQYDQESKVPVFLTAANLKPFVDDELLRNSRPIMFRPRQGAGVAIGYKADLLPQVCNVFLDAKDAGALQRNQLHIAERCKVLSRGFAVVGITALIDEATGFQDDRARDALAKILEAFIAKELRKWVRTFPVDYYKELFRLRGLPYAETLKSPSYIGHLTNDLVYARLAPGVLTELRQKNPVIADKGRRRHKHFQWLSDEVGDPKLRQHLSNVVTLMKASDNWDDFKRMIDRALPPYSRLPLLAVMDGV